MTENDRQATKILNLAVYLIRRTAEQPTISSEDIVKAFLELAQTLHH